MTVLSKIAQEAVLKFCKEASQDSLYRQTLRTRFQAIDKVIAREVDRSKDTVQTKLAERTGDPTKFRNIIAPIVSPKIENAVTYQASVFLTGSPLFEALAGPEFQEAAQQVTAAWEENANHGGWVSEFIKFFRDGFHYNICAVEVDWENRVTYGYKPTPDNAKGYSVANYNWSGNVLKHMDMYNTFWDSRVQPHEVSTKGEYAGHVESISRIALNSLLRELPQDGKLPNDDRARQSNLDTSSSLYHIPQINLEFFTSPNATGKREVDWEAIAGISGVADGGVNSLSFPDSFEKVTVYARICPRDLGMTGVESPNTPQIWKFITVNNDVLIYAAKQTNMHNRIPVLFAQPKEFGRGVQTRSMAEDLESLQSCVTSLTNSAINGRRRAVADRAIYNPRLIDPAHLREDSPTARIPLRPAASVTSRPSDAYFPIPFQDSLASSMSELGIFTNFADQVTGQNPVRGGQFVKGNKTKQEFDTVMGNANGRDQVMAMHFESRVFTPIKEILLANTIQFQQAKTVPTPDKKSRVTLDPEKIRIAALTFKVSDGLIPSEKLMNTESTAVAFQTLQAIPQLAQEYRVGELFAYLMKQRGAEIDDFRKSKAELMYEQAMGQWQQLAQMAMEKGMQFSTPQPKPQDYGVQVNDTATGPTDSGIPE